MITLRYWQAHKAKKKKDKKKKRQINETKESQSVTWKATSKIICMHAPNIHLFLATQKQLTQLCQSPAFCWEIVSIKAKLSALSVVRW